MKIGELAGAIAADMGHCAGLIENGHGDEAAKYLRTLSVYLLTGNYSQRPLFASSVSGFTIIASKAVPPGEVWISDGKGGGARVPVGGED